MFNSLITKIYNTPVLSNKKFQIALLIYALLAPISYHLMPYMGFYGADLSMQYFFNICEKLAPLSANLFSLTGEMCNNNNSHYAYPVLIHRFFSFTKLFSTFESFYYFWSALIVITVFSGPFIWLKKKNIKQYFFYVAIGLLTLIQAPTFFAIERGGTDIAFLIPWILAAFFGLRNQWIIAGILMALAALMKLYPAMAIAPMALGLLLNEKDKFKINFLKYSLAVTLTAIVVFSLDWHLWKIFLLEVLPNEMKYHIGTNAIGHSLIGPFSKFFVYPFMFICWTLYAQIFALKNIWFKKFAFAATLAMSTYFNGHSFDYNLITIFPFLYMSFELYFDQESPIKGNLQFMWGIILLSFTLLGPANYLFSHFKIIMKLKLIIELCAFVMIPIAILKLEFPHKNRKEHLTPWKMLYEKN